MDTRRILIGICSCERNAVKRKAVRDTWLTALLDGVAAVFFVGNGVQVAEPNSICLAVPDDYEHLPLKVHSFYRRALDDFAFDYLFKCDDDTYVAADRLPELIGDSTEFVGNCFVSTSGVASGGAGYLMSRKIVQIIVDATPPKTGAEDVWVSSVVKKAGAKMEASCRLRSDHSVWPTADNNIITAHWCVPDVMRTIHHCLRDTETNIVEMSFDATHSMWKGLIRLMNNGIFVGGADKPNGHYEWKDCGEFLILRWFHWPHDTLRRVPHGFENEHLHLEQRLE